MQTHTIELKALVFPDEETELLRKALEHFVSDSVDAGECDLARAILRGLGMRSQGL